MPDSLDELVVERVGQEQAGTRLTHLAGVHAAGEQRPVDRGLDVGVVEHDVGPLAAQLERDFLHIRGRQAHDLATHGGRAGEGDLAHVGMRSQPRPDRGIAGHDVEDAGRQPTLLADPRELKEGEWGLLIGPHHTGVPGGQCRPQLPDGQEQREVPGHDPGANSKRLAPDRAVCQRWVDELRTGLFERVAQRQLSKVIEVRDRVADMEGRRLADGRAVRERLELRQLVQAFAHARCHGLDHSRPLLGRLLPPLALLVGAPGRLDRPIGVLDAAAGNRGHDFPGGGADDFEDLVSVNPLTADKHLVVLSVGCCHLPQLLSTPRVTV